MNNNLKVIITIVFAILISIPTYAQIKGNGEITKKTYTLEEFDAIEVGGARNVFLSQGDGYSVTVETDSNIQDFVELVVSNNTLKFKFTNAKIKKYTKLNFYVTAPYYKGIRVSGASNVSSTSVISGDMLKLNASGSSDIKLEVDYKNIVTNLSGASDITLSGKTETSVVESSGASDFSGKDLYAQNTVISSSGASSCFVNSSVSLTYEASGASDVKYVGNPATVVVNKGNSKEILVKTDSEEVVTSHGGNDTTSVNMGVLKVTVVDGDTTQVSVGRHKLVVTEDGDVDWKRCKVDRFNGHWGGVELGINGFVNSDFNSNLKPQDEYLSLRWEKSINVNLNLYEQNISLNKAKNIGLVTGIGFQWNNYRFAKQTSLTNDSSAIAGYYMNGVSVRKTKLTAMYLTVPLMFEIQSKHDRRINRFHFAIGAQASARISTHTKIYFNESNKAYDLLDPVSGNPVATGITPNSNSRNIVKNFNGYHLAPFKFDAMVRFGYGIINIYATYSLNQMFVKNQGPELYPFSAGITLAGW